MQIKASITHTVYFEVPDGSSVEEIRAHALGQIDDNYSNEESDLGTPENLVSGILETAVRGTMVRESVEIGIAEAK